MAEKTLVEQIGSVIEVLKERNGPFALAMLLSSSEAGDSDWNLILSSDWTDRLALSDALKIVVGELGAQLKGESSASVARVTVLRTTDPFVLHINSLFRIGVDAKFGGDVAKSHAYISNSTFGGVHVPRAVIFYSEKPQPAVSN